jgi:hypothetical protein
MTFILGEGWRTVPNTSTYETVTCSACNRVHLTKQASCSKKEPQAVSGLGALSCCLTLGFYAEGQGCRGMGWPPSRGLSALDN